MSANEMTVTAREYREIQADIERLKAQSGALKQKMIAEMDARQCDELAAGEYKIRYTVYESSRLDTARLKTDHTDLYNQYTKRAAAARFQVA
jgi:predicted phage-related endonuclease